MTTAGPSDTTVFVLMLSLEAAVPLWIEEFRGLTFEEREKIAHEASDIIASKGDVLQFRAKKKGETAKAFNALARGLAVLAYAPGGVTFNGRKWEAK